MVTSFYADVNHVGMAVKRRMEEVEVSDDRTASISVFDGDVVMRGIDRDEARDRNLFGNMGECLCSVKYDGIRLKLQFHENVVEKSFTLRPAGPRAIAPQQADNPHYIAPRLEPVVKNLVDELGEISWDFTEVSAASIANGGHFTDFEFEYVITVME